MIGAVVLAAGLSKRMGCPKMTLPWGNTTVIEQISNVLLAAGVEDVIVVTGGGRDEVENALKHLPVRTIFNPDFSHGEMISTLQTGLKELNDGIEGTLVVLGDQPQIKLTVVKSVINAFTASNQTLVVPSYQKRRGHPWLVARELWDDLLAVKTPTTMRAFLNGHAPDICYVSVDTPSILQDLDTPEDYQRFQHP